MPLTYSPSVASAYADGSPVAKGSIRGHFNQAQTALNALETAVNNIDTTPTSGTYTSVAAFNAATIPAALNQVSVINGSGEAVSYRRLPGANGPQDLHHPTAGDWAKASLTQADLLASLVDVTSAIDRIPFQSGVFGGMTIVPQTPGTFACTYTVQRISWQRVGHTVTFEFRLAGTPTIGTGSGQLRITGFPFVTAAANAGGAVIRSSQGVNWRHYVGGTPGVPAFVAGFFPDAVNYMVLTSGAAAGEVHSILPIDRLTTGTPFRIEAFGQYELQV